MLLTLNVWLHEEKQRIEIKFRRILGHEKEYRIAVAGTGYVGLSIAAPTNVYLKLSVAI